MYPGWQKNHCHLHSKQAADVVAFIDINLQQTIQNHATKRNISEDSTAFFFVSLNHFLKIWCENSLLYRPLVLLSKALALPSNHTRSTASPLQIWQRTLRRQTSFPRGRVGSMLESPPSHRRAIRGLADRQPSFTENHGFPHNPPGLGLSAVLGRR